MAHHVVLVKRLVRPADVGWRDRGRHVPPEPEQEKHHGQVGNEVPQPGNRTVVKRAPDEAARMHERDCRTCDRGFSARGVRVGSSATTAR